VTGRRAALALALALALGAGAGACDRGPTIDSCADSLAGVWRDDRGRAWAVIDGGPRLEVYPSFADNELPPGAPPELEVAPRLLDLQRAGDQVAGVVHRRFMRADHACDAVVRVRVTACRAGTLELELAEPPAPTGFEPCAFPTLAPPPVSRWTWTGPLR